MNQTTQNVVNQKTANAMMSSEMSKNNLEDISEKIYSIKEEFLKNSMQEVTNEFIIIINNTLVASNQQESLITKSNGIRSNSPEIRVIYEAQNNINRELNQIMAQLLLLSNKTFAIKPAINRAFGKARSAIMNSITSFEQKKINSAVTSQKDALNSINLVTQLLLDALDELQESGSPSGFEEFMASLEEMAKQQQGLNQSTMQLSQLGMMQQQGLLKELQSQQEQLKKQLQDLLGEFPGENEGSMEKIGKDMDEIIQDFKNKHITRETIKRQKQILSRIL